MNYTALSSTLITASHQRRGQGSSQSDAAYRVLKEKIVTLEFPPASVLNESQLMTDLDLGRTPIREALQRLALENLVVILPRRGTIVTDLNMSDLQKVFELRLELEALAVCWAAERATTAQISAMENLLADADDLLKSSDHRQLIRLDREAHRLLAQAANNEFLEAALEQLYMHVLRLWYVSLHKISHLAEAIEEHRDIIAAIKRGDGTQAARMMRNHIATFQQDLASML